MSLEQYQANKPPSSPHIQTYRNLKPGAYSDLSQEDISRIVYNYALESQVTSEITEESKSSLEIDGLRFSQELEKILSKHLKNPSVIEKNVTNTYQGLLEGLKPQSLSKVSEATNEESQKENSKSGFKDICLSDSSQHPQLKTKRIATNASLRTSTFALTNRIFCINCSAEVFTNVSYQMKRMNLWGSIGFILDSVKCCGEPRVLSRYQELVHSCKQCGSIVARICSN